MEDLIKDIKSVISEFQQSLSLHLPALEAETEEFITSKSQDKNAIEHYLDRLLSLTTMGVGNDLFVKLLEYYKTIDSEGAAFYWEEYTREE
ncbi:MAG: hypothetical protein EAS52_14635 [Parapedobacter sp.]|nr:MAG: hypothetical protein EAS52_14635 [Parapedobacter sp.]